MGIELRKFLVGFQAVSCYWPMLSFEGNDGLQMDFNKHVNLSAILKLESF